jgi:hypothetical protein
MAGLSFSRFTVFIIYIMLLRTCVWCKICTNIPPKLQSHTYHYAFLSSNNETWKQEVYSSYYGSDHDYGHSEDHLISSDDSAWSSLLSQRRLNEAQESALFLLSLLKRNSAGQSSTKLRHGRKLLNSSSDLDYF